MPKLDDEIKRLLKIVVDHFDSEDRIVRERQLRHYRRLKLYWNNFSQIYWSESARDYRIYGADDLAYDGNDQEYYDRPVNVFRAFLETIIAALSIQIPGIVCVPDDAENPDDLSTAKAGDKIGELLYKHNDIMFLWLHALYIHCTEGMVACYVYEKEDKTYGTYEEKKYKNEEIESYVCPHCGERLKDEVFQQQLQQQQLPLDQLGQIPGQQPNQQDQIVPPGPPDFEVSEEIRDGFAPDDDNIDINSELDEQGPLCTACLQSLDPELQKTKLTIPRFVGMNTKPKSRICFDIKGGLYVKVANYANQQKDTPYLIYSYETHYANALHTYPRLRDDLPQGGWAKSGVNDPYEQYARLNPQYRNAFPEEQVTVKNTWLRPASFEILNEEDCEKLTKLYPDGAKVVMVNDICADAENESLDDCWTLTRNPIHDFLNHDPMGELLTNLQDITNDLISLTLQTIEHGITQTWADPAVVNFEAQTQLEAAPGYITPTKLQGGSKNISESFFSTKSAALSPEIFQFYQIVQQLGQFVSAAMPSIFGGSQDSGSSRTASEYQMSRTASLQRLQTTWRMFSVWWKTIFGKAIPAYMKLIKRQGDERIVERKDSGSFVNTIIRRAEVSGKIGSVEIEHGDTIPVSDEQKADVVMKLMELNNMEIMNALTSPENLPFIRKVVKMPEFRLPGEDDRTKQHEEIQLLINSEPIIIPPDPIQIVMAQQQGQPPVPTELPSVEVDLLVDDHQIEASICRSWLISEAGRLAKTDNPNGYKNVLLHMKAHMDILAQQQQAQMMAQAAQASGQPPANGNNGQRTPAKPKQEERVKEGSDARSPIQ